MSNHNDVDVQQNPGPMIVQVVPQPTEELSVGDVLLASVGLTGALVLLSLVLAGLFGVLLVRWNKRHPPELDHPPSINPDARHRRSPVIAQLARAGTQVRGTRYASTSVGASRHPFIARPSGRADRHAR